MKEYLTLSEASELIGKSKETLRRWDREGKLSAVREPMSNYRVYKKTEVESLFSDFLAKEFKGYPFWIANYNGWVQDFPENATFWQFTEKGSVKGIRGNVDVNLYNGTPRMLLYQTIR